MRSVAFLLIATALVAAGPERWRAMPLLSAEQRAASISPGGEGCQRVQCIAIDARDGNTLLFATDVGGVYRSLDGGAHWSPCNMGLAAVGAANLAIDPADPDRILLAGDNSGNAVYPYDGVWLSTDRGASWRQVLSRANQGRDETLPIAWDPSSVDRASGHCRTAFWAEELDGDDPGGRLWRSDDGGETWHDIAAGAAYGGGDRWRLLHVLPDGTLLIANANGLWRSRDHGTSFTRMHQGRITALDAVPAEPQRVWIACGGDLLRSEDGATTFTVVPHQGPSGFDRLAVSPADPRSLLAMDPKDHARWVSHDAGATWTRFVRDLGPTFAPHDICSDERNFQVVWHPTDPRVAYGTGPGDIVTSSRDGGLTWRWGANGYNGIMIGGGFNFAPGHPGVCYFGSQDFNGALTTDGGATWRLLNLTVSNTREAVRPGGDDSDAWGWVYGGYSPDGVICYGGNREYMGKGFDLWISFDGGKTSERKARDLQGAQVSCGDPADPAVLFCWGMRSTDRGRSWTRMADCDGVYIASAGTDRALLGAKGRRILRSTDHGATWTRFAELPPEARDIRDLAYDHGRDLVWVAAGDNGLWRCPAAGPPVNVRDRLPADLRGDGFATSAVAVDPGDPRVVYAAACGNGLFIQRDNSVARSLDGGETWQRLTGDPRFAPAPGVSAAQMTSAIRVDPTTRELWALTCCYGCWRFPPPTRERIGSAVSSTPNRAVFPPPPLIRHTGWRTGPDMPEIALVRSLGDPDYCYGPDWHQGGNVRRGELDGRTCLKIETSENGGAGLLLGGMDIAPDGQTAVAIELRPLPGNAASGIGFNLIPHGDSGKGSLSIDLTRLPSDRFTTIVLPLPGRGPWRLDQIQVQGGNWSPGARALRVAIARIGSVLQR